MKCNRKSMDVSLPNVMQKLRKMHLMKSAKFHPIEKAHESEICLSLIILPIVHHDLNLQKGLLAAPCTANKNKFHTQDVCSLVYFIELSIMSPNLNHLVNYNTQPVYKRYRCTCSLIPRLKGWPFRHVYCRLIPRLKGWPFRHVYCEYSPTKSGNVSIRGMRAIRTRRDYTLSHLENDHDVSAHSRGRRLSSRWQLVFSHAFKQEYRDLRIKDAPCSVYPWERSVTSRSFL